MPGVEKDIASALDSPGARRAVDEGGKKSGRRFGGALGGAAVAGIAAAGVGLAIAGLVGYLNSSVDAAKEAQTAQLQLSTAYEKFPAVASVSIESLRELNNELMRKTRFDDDALASGQATLAQYGLTGEQLTKLTPLLADYAARTGKDVTAAASDLGKAMLGQGRALKSVGIDFEDAGSVAANFDQVMAGLTSQVGGFATKEGVTAAGTAERMKNAFGEIQETIGGALLPAIVGFQTAFLDNVMPSLQAGAEWIAGVIGPALESLGSLFSSLDVGGLAELAGYLSPLGIIFKVLQPILPMIADMLAQIASVLGDAFSQVLPVLLPVLAEVVGLFGSLAAQVLPMLLPIVLLIVDVFADLLVALLPVVMTLIDALLPVISALIPVVVAVLGAFMPLISALVEALAPILEVIAEALGAILVPILDIVIGLVKLLASVITWLVKNIVVPFIQGVLIPVVLKLGDIFKAVFSGLGDFFEGLWKGIGTGFKAVVNFIIDLINGFLRGLNEVGNFVSDITGGAVDVNFGLLPHLAEGATVLPRRGGTLAVLAEAGRAESVVDTGLLNQALREGLAGGGDGQVMYLVLEDGTRLKAYVRREAGAVVEDASARSATRLAAGGRSGA
jgi:phage-related protein